MEKCLKHVSANEWKQEINVINDAQRILNWHIISILSHSH